MMMKTQMEKVISGSHKNIGGIVVLKEGKLVYESYRNDFTASSCFHIFSATKSITSMLIGIAEDKGLIKEVDQKIIEFFPSYQVQMGEKHMQTVTLKNMLTMTAPFKHKKEDYKTYFSSLDWVKASLDQLGGQAPSGKFRYAGVIGPDIFTGILRSCTKMSVIDFAREFLFEPLGVKVSHQICFANEKEQLAWYEEKQKLSGWVTDPSGNQTGGWGLVLTVRDMAKLGQLYLQQGNWEGRQLISADWIKESTTKKSSWQEIGMDYGYLWWLVDEEQGSYAALGDGGNVIYINPKKDLVIAIGATFMPKAADRLLLIKKYIEPVFE